ncbi:MAG: hypothetical protein MUC55_00555 [Burkholderiales bacterium]|jgi:hypothetical protein|nr:hypothetical protein [Burkholderiales bacterium]
MAFSAPIACASPKQRERGVDPLEERCTLLEEARDAHAGMRSAYSCAHPSVSTGRVVMGDAYAKGREERRRAMPPAR